MEDTDSLIFSKLTELGCVLPNNIENLNKLPHNFALPIAQRCLDKINGDDEDTSIPESKGDQVLLASKLAAACKVNNSKDLGYEGELGYDLFIYPNEHDLRAVLIFLLNKLSIECKSQVSVDVGDLSLMQKISQKIREELEKPWIPLYCKTKGFNVGSDGTWTRDGCCYAEPFQTIPFKITRDTKNMTDAFLDYWKTNVPKDEDLFSDTKESTIQADIILKKIRSKGGFNFNVLSSCPEKVEEIDPNETEEILPENPAEAIDIENLSVDMLYDKNERNVLFQALFSNEGSNGEKVQALEDKLNFNVCSIKEKLNAEKMVIAEYEEIAAVQNLEVKDNEVETLEIRIKKKAQKLKKVKRNRSHLIMSPDKERLIRANDVTETIDRLSRIKSDTSNMITNVNSVQKDINRINGVLDRSFVVADEMIFKDAKKDEFARKTYKLIANVHTECNELCNMVKEIGVFTRDFVVLEKNVETAQRKNTKENLERATSDLMSFSRKETDNN